MTLVLKVCTVNKVMHKKIEPYVAMGIIVLFCAVMFLPSYAFKAYDFFTRS